ncbi:Exo-beta-D-glucosaminidase [Actinidia chinensis var. chinensis]|uniref:Exo-beta-D-glucosaminidase n=1 Tax=Actinidia chinensis var. chinensis TaxID=1590841 RepID=A0A2R6P5V1_ACTCC|nr:Exo-beta-D-glucosaminidase [Actinidia chinensis var. chinensis]
MATSEKPVMVVGIDDSEHSVYALEWALDHFFAPYAPNFPFNLAVVHARPTPTSAIGFAGPEAAEVLWYVDADLKKIAARIMEKAKEICCSKSCWDPAHFKAQAQIGSKSIREAQPICYQAQAHDHAILLPSRRKRKRE